MIRKQGFKETGIERIPVEWNPNIFSDVVNVNPKRSLRKGTEAKYVSMADLKEFDKKIQTHLVKEFKGGSKFQNRDTLMARITPCLENGKTAFVDILNEDEVGFGSTEFIVLSGKDAKTTNEFVYYLSRLPKVRDTAIKSMVGTSGRQRVQNDVFNRLIIALPPITEQKAIAKILSDLDDKIELNRQMNATLEQIGQAIFKHWFVDFEFPNEDGKPYRSSGGEMVDSEMGEVPEGWGVGTIGDIAENPRRGVKPSAILADTSYVGLEHMPRKSIALGKWGCVGDVTSGKFQFQSGEIPFGKLRPYFHKVGIAAIDGVCSTDILVIVPKHQSWFGFVLGHMSSDEVIQYTDTISTGTKMPRANWKDLAQYEIIVPIVNVVEAFNIKINLITEMIVSNIHQSRAIAAIRDALLPKLMSGELRVPDVDKLVEVIE
ncbi:MAG: restriction endonuclease subunit S [Candidatus Methanogaster sp.]|uniref:Restriction endonuclease subunit S n=1 Tax=Candidatus Methanogaster sp. TaxID=3386292 RepID=A0AC61L3S5_9EURY|nr:MAG: restriction endonuclease subunit S [ANME-2 cluster archaeon]